MAEGVHIVDASTPACYGNEPAYVSLTSIYCNSERTPGSSISPHVDLIWGICGIVFAKVQYNFFSVKCEILQKYDENYSVPGF